MPVNLALPQGYEPDELPDCSTPQFLETKLSMLLGYEPDELPDCSTPHCEVRSEERKLILLTQLPLCKTNLCKGAVLLRVFIFKGVTTGVGASRGGSVPVRCRFCEDAPTSARRIVSLRMMGRT